MKRVEAMFSDRRSTNLYDHKDVQGTRTLAVETSMVNAAYVVPRVGGSKRYVVHAFLCHMEERSYVRRILALERRFGEGAHLELLDLCC